MDGALNRIRNNFFSNIQTRLQTKSVLFLIHITLKISLKLNKMF